MPWRRSRVGERARARSSVASGASSPPDGGQQRVHARRRPPCAGPARPGVPGDRRHHVARAVGGQLGAQHDRAARQVAAQPRRRGGRSRAGRGRGASAGPRGTSRAGSARPPRGLLDRDLGQAGDRGEVQELARLRRGGSRRRASSTTAPTTSSPEAIGTSAATPAGTCDGRSATRSADVAPQLVERALVAPRTSAATAAAEPRHDDRHRRAGGLGRQLGDPRRARRRRARRRPSRRCTSRRRSTSPARASPDAGRRALAVDPAAPSTSSARS